MSNVYQAFVIVAAWAGSTHRLSLPACHDTVQEASLGLRRKL